MSDEERLIKIETLLTHQGQQIRDLEEVVNLQRKDIEALSRRLEKAQARLADMESGQDDEAPVSVTEQAARDKPPHY